MDLAQATALVLGIIQFIKSDLIPTIWLALSPIAKKAAVAIVCLGVTLYKLIIVEHAVFTLPVIGSALYFLVKLFIACAVGYAVVKSAFPSTSLRYQRKLGLRA
jgi:hypothetical protein